MPGRRPLKDGKPRLLSNHLGHDGKAYCKAYNDLQQLYGPFSLNHIRFEAGRVALLRVQLQHWTQELSTAQRKRKNARGRCPSARDIERLARRQGLADGSYAAAIQRFEGLVKRAGGQDLAKEIESAMAGHGSAL